MDDLNVEGEQERHFIGNLLSDDESLANAKDVSFQQSANYSLLGGNNIHGLTSPAIIWHDPPPPYSPNPPPVFPNYTNVWPQFHENENTTYKQLSINLPPVGNYGSSAPKPTATVPPFQASAVTDETTAYESPSPVSDGRTSDSGTVSPDSRAKPIKWKKVDIAIEPQKTDHILHRQSSDLASQYVNGKSYSSVAQQIQQNHPTQQKKAPFTLSISTSKSLPKLVSGKGSKNVQNGKSMRSSPSQPTTPEDMVPNKPSKIVGLNPIESANGTQVAHKTLSLPVTNGSAVAAVANGAVSGDFQKIKRKKKGKNNAQKNQPKPSSDAKCGSRYLALSKNDDTALENGLSDDDDVDDSDYLQQIEQEKEEMRQQARRQLVEEKATEAESLEKMRDLENEMRVIFEKRKAAKQQRIAGSVHRQRRRKNACQLVLPGIVSAASSVLASVLMFMCTYIFQLVANVLILSYHAFVDGSRCLVHSMYGFVYNFISCIVTVLTMSYWNSIGYVRRFLISRPDEASVLLSVNAPIPNTVEDVLERLYDSAATDPYSLLGLTPDCTIDEIRCYYKRTIAVVKPDKKFNVGCDDAYNLLQTAYEMIGTPEKREEFANNSTLQSYMLKDHLDNFRELVNNKGSVMHCECGENHPIKRAACYDGRYCHKCGVQHPIRNGDIWADKRCFGFSWTYYTSVFNVVYEINSWANCPSNNLKHLKPHTHTVAYRLYNANLNSPVNNASEKHRCSVLLERPRSVQLPKEAIPWDQLCCCGLAVCPPIEQGVRNVPCCFGALFVPISTNAATVTVDSRLLDPDRAKRAGRRRRFR